MSFGIGNWMNCLENLCYLGVIINCAGVYFTSQSYLKIFTSNYLTKDGKIEAYIQEGHEPNYAINTGWNSLSFFLFIVAVEHVILIIQLVSENVATDNLSL